MLPKHIYEEVKKNIEGGVFKTLALVFVDDQQRRHNKYGFCKQSKAEALARIEFFNSIKLDHGNWILEAKPNYNTKSAIEQYKFKVGRTTIAVKEAAQNRNSNAETIIVNTETVANLEIDPQEYLFTLKENYRLTEENKTLLAENKALQEQLNARPLNDQAANANPYENIVTGLMGGLTSLAPLADKFFDLKERELSLKERANGFAEAKKPFQFKPRAARKPVIMPYEGLTPEQICDNLDQVDEATYNATLDDMEAKNPELYNQVMDIYEEEDGDTQEGNGTNG